MNSTIGALLVCKSGSFLSERPMLVLHAGSCKPPLWYRGEIAVRIARVRLVFVDAAEHAFALIMTKGHCSWIIDEWNEDVQPCEPAL